MPLRVGPAEAAPGRGDVFARLQQEVIAPGLCTHCGTCVGLSAGTLRVRDTARGPLPRPAPDTSVRLPDAAWIACPGKGLNYPDLCRTVFGSLPRDWLLGHYHGIRVGYSLVPEIRSRSASGGIITQTLVYLLQQKLIDGAVVVRQGHPRPWLAAPTIATSVEAVLAASQSVYVPVPVNAVLSEMETFPGRLAYVGLPDQVASLRRLQQLGHAGAQKVDYVLGPYVGTAVYFGAIEGFLRAHGVTEADDIAELRYREGAWPGFLHITTRTGRVLRVPKFYYNYLIPFYITRSSLLSVDFTNELTDLSVGDAWHPRYEARGGGFSIVISRSEKGEAVLRAMRGLGLVALEDVSGHDAVAMHGHMLDFKKRGAFIRIDRLRAAGRPAPDYGYRPRTIAWSRRAIEAIIGWIFALCGTAAARRLVEHVPVSVLGPIFERLRRLWKRLSKPAKRRGLAELGFDTWPAAGDAREPARPRVQAEPP